MKRLPARRHTYLAVIVVVLAALVVALGLYTAQRFPGRKGQEKDKATGPDANAANVPASVADSVKEVRASAHYITRHPGGRGAVREVCDLILKIQGKWTAVTRQYAGHRELP